MFFELFLFSDGTPVMASGTTSGHVVLWDLEKKQTISMVDKAHSGSVTGMKFFHKQPLLVTSGPDNSLKVKTFIFLKILLCVK